MKTLKIENKIVDFIEKHIDFIILGILVIVALAIRYKLRSFQSGDYVYFLEPWFNQLKAGGGLKAIANYSGDYNYPYVTILALLSYTKMSPLICIKAISVFFEFILSFVTGKFILKITKSKLLSYMGAIGILYIPTLLLNGSYWGQCDIIYTTFTVLSLYYLHDKKYIPSFIYLGLAFSFKLQFIFILPLYIILYFNKRNFSILNFLIIPLTNFILCIPAMLVGTNIIDCLTVYFNQTTEYASELVLNFPNFYTFFDGKVGYFSLIGIVFVLFIFAVLLYLIIKKKPKINFESIMILSIFSIVVCTYFLPFMHERYMFAGGILAFIYCFTYKKMYLVAILLEFISLIAYICYFNGVTPIPYTVLSIVYGGVIIYLIKVISDRLKLIND